MSQVHSEVNVDLRQIEFRGQRWFAAEDVAEMLVSLGHGRLARQVREEVM